MNLHASGTWGIRVSGDQTIIPAQSQPTEATGDMAEAHFLVRQLRQQYDNNWPTRQHRKLDTQLIVPAPRPRVAGRPMALVANAPLMFPEPRRLQCNTPQLSAGRHLAVHLPAYKVRKRREAIAIAANKVCRLFPILRQFRDQHPLVVVAAAGMLAVVAPVAMAAMVMKSGINLYPYDFQKYISDGIWTRAGFSGLCSCTTGTDFFFTKRCCQCFGCGSHKS
jgi:hypothetical protein